MSIQLVCGLPGHGKGCLAVDRILKDIALGRRVLCNFPVYARPDGSRELHPKITFFETWEDIRGEENGRIYLDEAPRWFSSRAYAKNTPEDLEFFAQHRHNGLSLILICQSPQQLDVEIRDRLAAYVWYIKRLLGPDPDTDGPTKMEKLIGWNALVRKFVASDFKSAKRFVLKSYNMNLQQFHGWYDTDWIIGGRDGKGTGFGKTNRAGSPANLPVGSAEAVTLSDGSKLTKEQYLAGMQQQTPGSLWTFAPPVEAVEDTLFRVKGKQADVETVDGGAAVGGFGSNGSGRGTLARHANDPSGSPVGGSHKRVFKLVKDA